MEQRKTSAEAGPVTKVKVTERLSHLPSSIINLAESLEHLDLSGTGLSHLPRELGRFTALRVAFFSNCHFDTFPKELASCPQLEMVAFRGNGMTDVPADSLPLRLRWLILTNNQITALPASIGRCSRLQKCMLAGNQLRDLPKEMAACEKLSLLRLSSNCISKLPSWLFELPELAFLSFAGNPCLTMAAQRHDGAPALTHVSWEHLQVQELLGEGASGMISKGLWKRDSGRVDEVAIKLFKGDVTSDGTPMDEMQACIKAGSHGNLINPLGQINNHPDKKGLVLQLIPPSYTTLGLPPSLQSCTRDHFRPSTTLGIWQALTLLQGIASAAAHLHDRGIAHGDLYAHNILYCESGHALLCDFGAATSYLDYSVERLEVLAFAHLVEDVWGLIRPCFDECEVKAYSGLRVLHGRCAEASVSKRPLFADIVQELGTLRDVPGGGYI